MFCVTVKATMALMAEFFFNFGSLDCYKTQSYNIKDKLNPELIDYNHGLNQLFKVGSLK